MGRADWQITDVGGQLFSGKSLRRCRNARRPEFDSTCRLPMQVTLVF
jgi:hypothetical protein